MNKSLPAWIPSAACIAAGVASLVWIGPRLSQRKELNFPLNPFGINRSPYGEVAAMAVQGPISTDFNVGMYGVARQKKSEQEGDKQANSNKPKGLRSGLLGNIHRLIEDMRIAHVQRTNPRPASEALKTHLRSEAEDKLRFAYRLDPSHYASYTALHFFLVEGISGDYKKLTPEAAKLAEDTIEYCLSIDNDPRPALTAAAACNNILQLMFESYKRGEDQYSIAQMEAVLKRFDQCVAAYNRIAQEWLDKGNWERLSDQRVGDIQERYQFNLRMRQTAKDTIERFRQNKPK
ncbi:MAG: hypothetical protein R3242_00675 [Akkermansiaceae bacterium]|nr:hypothetical protein [Akkermansiaceae bacterium]